MYTIPAIYFQILGVNEYAFGCRESTSGKKKQQKTSETKNWVSCMPVDLRLLTLVKNGFCDRFWS